MCVCMVCMCVYMYVCIYVMYVMYIDRYGMVRMVRMVRIRKRAERKVVGHTSFSQRDESDEGKEKGGRGGRRGIDKRFKQPKEKRWKFRVQDSFLSFFCFSVSFFFLLESTGAGRGRGGRGELRKVLSVRHEGERMKSVWLCYVTRLITSTSPLSSSTLTSGDEKNNRQGKER